MEKGLNKKNETKAEDGEDFKSWKKKNGGEEGDVLGLYKKWKAEKGLNKKKKVKELEDYVEIEQRKIESGKRTFYNFNFFSLEEISYISTSTSSFIEGICITLTNISLIYCI